MNDVINQFANKGVDRTIRYTNLIEEMLNNVSEYGYAESTLFGIYDYIEREGTITDNQVRAVENIHAKPSKPYYGKRRY